MKIQQKRSMKQSGFLGKEAKKKTKGHGQKPHKAKLGRPHLQKLPEPFLHGFREGKIGHSFKNKNQTDKRKKKFHRGSLPEPADCRNTGKGIAVFVELLDNRSYQ